jgi:hypothetical protein
MWDFIHKKGKTSQPYWQQFCTCAGNKKSKSSRNTLKRGDNECCGKKFEEEECINEKHEDLGIERKIRDSTTVKSGKTEDDCPSAKDVLKDVLADPNAVVFWSLSREIP